MLTTFFYLNHMTNDITKGERINEKHNEVSIVLYPKLEAKK